MARSADNGGVGRAKVAVGILLASTFLAVGVSLGVDRTDEVERLICAVGAPRRAFLVQGHPPKASMFISVTLPAQEIKSCHLWLELKRRGWRFEFNRPWSMGDTDWAFLSRSWDRSGNSVRFAEQSDGLEVGYSRPPTPLEKVVHAVKSFLHIPD